MAEELVINKSDRKEDIYKSLLPQIKSLISSEKNQIANMANTCAALKEAFDFFWIGFYLVEDNELVLGPFQGPIACTRIQNGKGVCGKSWSEKKSIIVEDVNQFPGHIACSSLSKSEIVIPGIIDEQVVFVLDVDSDKLNDFDLIDQRYLELIVKDLLA